MNAARRKVVLNEATFVAAVSGGQEASLVHFTRRLKRGLKDADVVPLPGLDLSQSLEAFMKLARHHFETLPQLTAHLERAERGEADARQAITKGRELCDTIISVGVWMRNNGAPLWMYRWLSAPGCFQRMSAVAGAAGQHRLALHWIVALLVLPSTLLGRHTPNTGLMNRRDIELMVSLQNKLGVQALKEEIEAWHDLYSCYRLFA